MGGITDETTSNNDNTINMSNTSPSEPIIANKYLQRQKKI